MDFPSLTASPHSSLSRLEFLKEHICAADIELSNTSVFGDVKSIHGAIQASTCDFSGKVISAQGSITLLDTVAIGRVLSVHGAIKWKNCEKKRIKETLAAAAESIQACKEIKLHNQACYGKVRSLEGKTKWVNQKVPALAASLISAKYSLFLRQVACVGKVISLLGSVSWKNKERATAESDSIVAQKKISICNVLCQGKVKSSSASIIAKNVTVGSAKAHQNAIFKKSQVFGNLMIKAHAEEDVKLDLSGSIIHGDLLIRAKIPIESATVFGEQVALRENSLSSAITAMAQLRIAEGSSFWIPSASKCVSFIRCNGSLEIRYKGSLKEFNRGPLKEYKHNFKREMNLTFNDKKVYFSGQKIQFFEERPMRVKIFGGKIEGKVIFLGCQGQVESNDTEICGGIVGGF